MDLAKNNKLCIDIHRYQSSEKIYKMCGDNVIVLLIYLAHGPVFNIFKKFAFRKGKIYFIVRHILRSMAGNINKVLTDNQVDEETKNITFVKKFIEYNYDSGKNDYDTVLDYYKLKQYVVASYDANNRVHTELVKFMAQFKRLNCDGMFMVQGVKQ